MNHPELVHGLELLPCAIRDGMLYIPHADGNWVSAAKMQPFSLEIIKYWRREQALAAATQAKAAQPAQAEAPQAARDFAFMRFPEMYGGAPQSALQASVGVVYTGPRESPEILHVMTALRKALADWAEVTENACQDWPEAYAVIDAARDLAFTSDVSIHPATRDLVERFSHALMEKLAVAERKYGYSDGWAESDWMDECRKHLMEHVAKGDPRDVAAYCAFLWHHGESTAPATTQQVAEATTVSVEKMVESVNGVSWWVVLRRGKERLDDGKYGADYKNRAEWHAAGLRWILGQGDKPNMREFGDLPADSSAGSGGGQ